ncbi:glycosyltransferase [Nonomuraea sp. NPDC050663]|uniref:glycosyltransferase n=1 Tax=Nonomuraea sp. NPDC050663 TaxID=3364370 RepID=UPI0037AF41ED
MTPADLIASMPKARVFHVGLEAVPGGVDLDHELLDLDVAAAPEVLVLAGAPADLRRAATLHKLLPDTGRVVVAILDSPPSHPAPVPTPTPAHRWRALTDLRVHQPRPRLWLVEASFSKPTPAGRVVTAVARAFAGHRLDVIAAPAAALAGVGAADWRPGDPNATPVEPAGPVPDRVGAPGGDMVLRTVDSFDTDFFDAGFAGDEEPIDRPTTAAATWESLGRPGGTELAEVLTDPTMIPPVDERLVNPMGFVTTPSKGMGVLAEVEGRWTVLLDGRPVAVFAESGGVTDADVARLRPLRGVEVDWHHGGSAVPPARSPHTGPLAAVRVVAGLAAAGVPLVAEEVPRWAGGLGEPLTALLTSPYGTANSPYGAAKSPDGTSKSPYGAEVLADELRREEHSVRLRREALRTHGVAARWEQLGAPAPTPPLTSVLLCTRRAEMVGFALEQVARQRGVQLEVILALHGVSQEHPSVVEALKRFDHPITVFESEAIFGEVLNEAAARASGSFLLKMDDDDWYGPDFLSDLLLAHAYSGAQVVGTVPEFVYLSSIDVTVHRNQVTEQITSFVAGGTILVERSAFQAIGGFRPLRRSVDTQFQEALQAAGGQIYRTHGLGYILRRGPAANHTWQEPIGTFLQRNRRQWRGFRPCELMELT